MFKKKIDQLTRDFFILSFSGVEKLEYLNSSILFLFIEWLLIYVLIYKLSFLIDYTSLFTLLYYKLVVLSIFFTT